MENAFALPIKIRFLKVPVDWEIRTAEVQPPNPLSEEAPTTERVAFGNIDWHTKPTQLDGWHCREQFLGLPQNEQALLAFLDNVGAWEIGDVEGKYIRYTLGGRFVNEPVPVPLRDVWKFQAELLEIANSTHAQRQFVSKYASTITWYDRSFDLTNTGTLYNHYPLRFELDSSAPCAMLTTVSFYELVLATIYIDLIRGFRFKVCKRKDCPKKVFTIETGHKRIFCSQYCGHLESIRKKRRLDKKNRRGIGRQPK